MALGFARNAISGFIQYRRLIMGSALVVAVIPEERMMPGYLRIRRNGQNRRLLDVYAEDLNDVRFKGEREDYHPSTSKLLELYPDAYFILPFRPEVDVWQIPAHQLEPGWWKDKEEVARYSQEDVGGSLMAFLNIRLSMLRHMIRMPGRWLLGDVQVTKVECKASD
jgi:hypothetical protein